MTKYSGSEVFEPKMQEAIFGHMLTSEIFFQKCLMYVTANWFQNPRISKMASDLYKFYETHKRRPSSPNEFFTLFSASMVDMAEKRHYQQAFELCKQGAQTIGEDIIAESMTAWIKFSMYKESISEGASKYNKGQGFDAIDFVAKQMQRIQEASFQKNGSIDIPEPIAFYKDRRKQFTEGVSTGHQLFDEVLVGQDTFTDADNNTKQVPGFIKHEMSVIIGPSNSGKSTFFITAIRHALVNNQSVLYLTHEDNWAKYVDKLYQSLLVKSAKEISHIIDDAKQHDQIQGCQKFFKNLCYAPYNKAGGMYIEDVVSLIRILNNERKAKTGKGYDLLVSDYPGKLMSRTMSKAEVRTEQLYVYNQISQLADELGFHALVGVQTNRAGFKQSKDGDKMLTQDSVAESFGIVQIAHNVITINRSDDDIAKGQVHLHVSKSRSSQTGLTFTTSTNMGASLMWGCGLQARSTITDSRTLQALNTMFKEKKEKEDE